MMDASSWSRVKAVVDAALERTPDERATFVLQACGADRALREEVESLLIAMEQAGSFGERPALQSLASSQDEVNDAISDPTPHAFKPGDSLGPYTVLEFVGAGGMGEVYRARDARLNRDVALKIRSEAFAPDSDRLARFRREAQVLASLNHPNIAAIHGLEESDIGQALVLEFVDGPTLADRVAEGPLPLAEALSIAKQIADGFSAAHQSGVVHRDLKPSNIKLRPDGTVKILDFGLAKTVKSKDPRSVSFDALSVLSSVMSHAGVIFGTADYMSPEQALGRAVDKRTDIWAFGCVLYEIITGRRAFRGENVQDVLAAVLLHAPDWSALPANLPDGLVTLLHRCLEKDPDRRLQDVADIRTAIEKADAKTPVIVTWSRGRLTRWAAGVVATVAASAAVWGGLRPTGATTKAAQPMTRLLIGLPASEPLALAASMPLGLGQPSIAISSDGTRLVYVLERQSVRQLYLRALDQFDAAPIPKTEGAFGPFFSPDGRWIGFFAENKLRKVAVSGGSPITLCDAPNPYGGSWGADGTIVFSVDEGRRPMRVHETEGACQRVPVKDDRGSWKHPDILPSGKAAIVSKPSEGVGVLSLETGEFRVLVEGAGGGRYSPSGHVIFARPGALLAVPFELDRMTVTGTATVILEGVRTEDVPPLAQAAFSRNGTLVYAPGGLPRNTTRPVWVDRHGNVEPLGMLPRTYGAVSLSPDGRRLAIVIGDPNNDIWVQDLERGTLTRLTSGGNNVEPTWTPDGTRVAYTERTRGAATAFWAPADGSGDPEPLFDRGHQGVVSSFSPNNDVVAFHARAPDTGMDLWVRPWKGKQPPQVFLRTRATEAGAMFSSNGRWIAYASDESGQYEVYVRPYPPGPGKWRVSTVGGVHVIWSRDGKELFYRNGNKWMAVAVHLEPEFKPEAPRLLFEGPYVVVGGQSYDVAPDGRRFLVLEPAERDTAPVTHLNVVLNWFQELKQKVPALP
jgi:Tol biopolymer transport system component